MERKKKKIKTLEVIIEPSDEKIDLVEFVQSVLDWEDENNKK